MSRTVKFIAKGIGAFITHCFFKYFIVLLNIAIGSGLGRFGTILGTDVPLRLEFPEFAFVDIDGEEKEPPVVLRPFATSRRWCQIYLWMGVSYVK